MLDHPYSMVLNNTDMMMLLQYEFDLKSSSLTNYENSLMATRTIYTSSVGETEEWSFLLHQESTVDLN